MLARIIIAVLLTLLIHGILVVRFGFPLWTMFVLGGFLLVVAVLKKGDKR